MFRSSNKRQVTGIVGKGRKLLKTGLSSVEISHKASLHYNLTVEWSKKPAVSRQVLLMPTYKSN